MRSKYNLKTTYILSSVALFTGAVGFAHGVAQPSIQSNDSENQLAKTESKDNKSILALDEAVLEESNTVDGLGQEELAQLVKEVDETDDGILETTLPSTNSTYADSRKTAKAVTASNWKTGGESLYYESTNYSDGLNKTGKMVYFGVSNATVSGSNLVVDGWSVNNNHTHTNGVNNATYIALENTSTGKVTIVKANNVDGNMTGSFVWGGAYPSLRCREQTSDINKPISWQDNNGNAWNGKTLRTDYRGCYHDFEDLGFKASVPLEPLFGAGNFGSQYRMYIVNSTGANNIKYKKLVANQTKTTTYKGTINSGDVVFDAGSSDNKATIKESGEVFIRDSIYSSGYTTHKVVSGNTLTSLANQYGVSVASLRTLNGLENKDNLYVGQNILIKNNTAGNGFFKKGVHNIVDRRSYKGMTWVKLEGYGATAGSNGWITTNYVIDTGSTAILRYTVNSQTFNVNYMNQDNKSSKVKASVQKTVTRTGSDFNIAANTDLSIVGSNGLTYYRIYDGETKTYNRKFNDKVQPADINLFYDDALDFKVEYKDASGAVVKTETKTLNAGKSITTSVPKNTTFTANGNTYRNATAVTNTRTFPTGLTSTQYNALKNTLTINVEKQEEVALSVMHSGVDYTNKPIKTLSTETVKVKLYPSDGTKTYKVGAKGTSVDGAVNSLAKTAEMTSGNWQFSNRGIDSDGNVQSNPNGTDNVNNGFENISVNSATGAKSVTFNYMQDKYFYLNYMNQDNKALKVKDSVQQKLTWQKPDFNVAADTDLEIKGTNGLTYYRIYDGDTKTHSRTLNQLAAPTDINLFYDNAVDFKIEYKDASGAVVRTVNKTLNAGETIATAIPKNTAFTVNGATYRNTVDINDSRTFAKALTLTQYNALKNTITVNVEKQEEITLNIKHNAVDINNTLLSSLSAENLKVKLYPSEGNKTYKVASKGFGITGAMNNVTRTDNMVSGKWFFSGRGIDSDGNVQTNPAGTDPVNKGFENFVVNSTTGAKSVTFNYMQEQSDPNTIVQDTNNDDLTLTGQFNWFLTKPSGTNSTDKYSESYAELNNIININGASYAKRNGNSSIKVNNAVVGSPEIASGVYYSTSSTTGINRITIPKFKGRGALTTKVKQVTAENNSVVTSPKNDATFMKTYEEHNLNPTETKAAKDKNVNQEYSFEYTNEYIDIYKPATGYNIGGHVFLYEYTHTNTVWDNVTKVAIKTDSTNKLDHDIGDTVTLTKGDSAIKNIGRYATLNDNKPLPTKILSETIKDGSLVDNANLKTQSHIGISGQLTYSTPFDTTKVTNPKISRGTTTSTHTNKDFTYNANVLNSYLVNDVDESFRNASDFKGISTLKALLDEIYPITGTGISSAEKTKNIAKRATIETNKDSLNKFGIGIKATGTTDVTIDTNYNYYVMKNSGLLIETNKTNETDINNDAMVQAKDKFGANTSKDGVVYGSTEDRYYIPVDGASTLKPNTPTTYKNTYILSGVGLNDVAVVMQDTFKFEDYLVGDVQDEVIFNTQKEPLIDKGKDYSGATVITPVMQNTIKKEAVTRGSKSSNVRSTDSSGLWTKLNNLLKWK